MASWVAEMDHFSVADLAKCATIVHGYTIGTPFTNRKKKRTLSVTLCITVMFEAAFNIEIISIQYLLSRERKKKREGGFQDWCW